MKTLEISRIIDKYIYIELNFLATMHSLADPVWTRSANITLDCSEKWVKYADLMGLSK